MPYLIDSDWVIDHLADLDEATQLLSSLAEEGIAISVITYMEAFQGVERSSNPQEAQAKLDAFLEGVPVVPFSLAVARRCAVLRETLRTRGRRVNSRALDLLNAATALEYDLTLVTRNIEDYRDIPDLKIYEIATYPYG
ncbi:MAG: type II toxin-antitoxin system VapC family toxin [Chloroflexi bacterium]|nr:type II toxin-antitoxin system VapC family toxin [Chloroflexota bacterium]MDA8187108.1 type II toxin-antitoxin system VapC family toxin [Dehalococcoidales bacterium]